MDKPKSVAIDHAQEDTSLALLLTDASAFLSLGMSPRRRGRSGPWPSGGAEVARHFTAN